MLMNDKQVAVNDLILRLMEAADHYAHAADALDDPALNASLTTRRRECRDAATTLEPHIRRLGELPRQPDPEREALDQLLDRIAGIGADERNRLAAALIERESAIVEAAGKALDQTLPQETTAVIARIGGEAREQLAALEPLVEAQ